MANIRVINPLNEDYAPDFGLHMRELKGGNAEHHFLPFQLFSLSRVDDALYSTTCNTQFGDTSYAVTIDFSEDAYSQLLRALPDEIRTSVTQIFGGKFRNTEVIEFPSPITVGISARLGELISNEKEQYIPIRATNVFRIE